NSFPEKSPAELDKIEKEFYRNLCDYALEMLKTVTISPEELKRRMVFRNPGIIEEFARHNKSIIFFASHQFNWEWILVSASISPPWPIDFVYQDVNSRSFDRLMLNIRT